MFILGLSLLTSCLSLTTQADCAADVTALIAESRFAAASARTEACYRDAPPNFVFVQAPLLVQRWAHVYRVALDLGARVATEPLRGNILDQRTRAAAHIVKVAVVIDPGPWADDGALTIALVEDEAPPPWTWNVEEVRKKAGGEPWTADLSPGTWSITVTTQRGAFKQVVEIAAGRPGHVRQVRFATPSPPRGNLAIVVDPRCASEATELRVVGREDREIAFDGHLAGLTPLELAPGGYTVTLQIGGTPVQRTIDIVADAGVEAVFTCPKEHVATGPSHRPLWFSLGAAGLTGVAGAVAGGVGQVRGADALHADAKVLAAHDLTGAFNYGSCLGGDAWPSGSACERAAAVEKEYPSKTYHADLATSLQLRGVGVGLGSAGLGVAISGLPALARTPRQRRGWLIANAVLGTLTGAGGAVLLGISHGDVTSELVGFDKDDPTSGWRADHDDITAAARPWLAGCALIGFGGAMLINTGILALTRSRTALRATTSGLEIRF